MKKILILTFSFLLIGCSAEYTLTIDDNSYNENINIQSSNDEDRELLFSNTWMVPIDYYTYSEMDDSDYETNDKIEHYKYTAGDNNINFNYNFNSSTIQNSTALHRCYESSRIVKNNNQIIITTSNVNTCLRDNNSLEEMTINIIVNNDVKYSNEDEKVGNKYTWYINRNNYLQKSINITIIDDNNESVLPSSTNNTPSTSNNKLNILNFNTDINMIIFCIIFFVIVGIVILIYQKIQKDDK